MTRWLRTTVAGAALAALALACGSESNTGGATGAPFGKPGCAAPDCSQCSGCWDRCACATLDFGACNSACGAAAGGAGPGGAAGVGPGGAAGVGPGGAGPGGAGGVGGVPAVAPLAGGVRITEISVYQSVKIPIMLGGEIPPQSRNSPVIALKRAIVRVFVTTDAGFQPRGITARLELVSPANPAPHEIPRFVNAPSSETVWDSTYNFDIPAEHVTPDLQYAVALVEADSPTSVGDTAGSRFPTQGGLGFGALFSNGTLKLVIVPVIANGITPDVSPPRIQQYHDKFYSLYPAEGVEVNVRQAIPGPAPSAGGGGWSELLDFVLNVRAQDGVPGSVYYFGAVTPATTFQGYCFGGCVAGLGPLPGPGDQWGRGCVGLGFFANDGSDSSPDTAAHEIGHSMGRPHAPCGVGDAPPGYPYPGGSIGSWGYDLIKGQLKNPGTYTDIMGYCDPTWISDHNYQRLFDRLTFVNAGGLIEPPADGRFGPGRYRSLLVGLDGKLSWGGTHDLGSPPLTERRKLVVKDGAGRVDRELEGAWYPTSHTGSGILLVPVQDLAVGPGDFVVEPVDVGVVGLLPL